MSTVTEMFYGVRCDYPDCRAVYEGSEYSFWSDPGDVNQYAEDDGWLIDFEDKDYCETHTVQPVEECDDDDDHRGFRPLPDSFEARLDVAMSSAVQRANRQIDALGYSITEKLSPGRYGSFQWSIGRKLEAIHEAACKAFKPGITGQELFDLKAGRKR